VLLSKAIGTKENKTLNYFPLYLINSKSLKGFFGNIKVDKISPLPANLEVRQEKEEPKSDTNQLSSLGLLCGVFSFLFGLSGFVGSILLFFAAALNILGTLPIIGVLALLLVAIALAILSFSLSHKAHSPAKNTNNDTKMGKAVAGVVLSIIGLIFSAVGLILFLAVV
jgi:hypothetical protein